MNPLTTVPLSFEIAWASLLLASVLLWLLARWEFRRTRAIWVQLALAAAFQLAPASLGATWTDEVARAFLEIAAIQTLVLLLARLLRRGRLPRFLGDMISVFGFAAVLIALLSRLGVNVTGLIATSAVATAVIGLSLQELLGNLAGGIALELEKEIEIGAWIRTDLGTGWVNHIRFRHTSITTADGDVILIPNSVLTKSAVTLIPAKRRHLIKFSTNYEIDPSQIMSAVADGVMASPIQGMTTDPPARCVILNFHPEYVEYGVLAWLTEPGTEYRTYSEIRARIYYVLARLGAPLRPIPQILDLLKSGQLPTDDPNAALRHIPLFRSLTQQEVDLLAPRLKPLSFASGELVLRQGDPGESMFILLAGRATVSLQNSAGLSQKVAELGPGDFCGEMSLLTGEPRSATVIAQTPLHGLTLHKTDLADLMTRRAAIAEDVSLVMAERLEALAGIRAQLDAESAALHLQSTRANLLGRIQRYFGLSATP